MVLVLAPEIEQEVSLVLRVLWGEASTTQVDTGLKVKAHSAYALLPRSDAVKALVPTWPPSVTATVVRNYLTPTSRSQRVRAAALVLAARLGVFTFWPHSIRVGAGRDAFGLVGHLAQLLSRELVVGVFLGPHRVNRKPVLQLLTREGDLVAYVKVGTNDFTRRRVANEATALADLNRVALRAMSVPELLAAGSWHGDPFLVLAPVPTQSDSMTEPDQRRVAMHELSHSFGVETVPMVEASWWQEMVTGLAESSAPGARRLHALAAQVAEHCGDQILQLGAAHGDWSPWNMALVKGRAVVWDWERFRCGVPIGWDAVHFSAESHRRSGLGAGESLRELISAAPSITRGCGSSINDPHLVLTTYLLDLGHRYVVDGQATGVQPRGPITEWLLDPLTKVVQAMTDRSST